jgi:acyl-CoA thioester hydrolase
MEILKKLVFTIKVTAIDIDELNHVNNISYVQWVQLAAQKHWNLISNAQIDSEFVWVVLRHEIDYLSSALLDDELTVITWIGKSFGVKSERFVEILKEDKLLVKAKTIWCLLDKKTMKPLRIPPKVLNILT